MAGCVSTYKPDSTEFMPLTHDDDIEFVRAVRNNDCDALREAHLDHSLGPSQDVLNQALRYACGHGHVETIRVLCEGSGKRADINSKDEEGRTATYIAARMGQGPCLGKLLELGADVNSATAQKTKCSDPKGGSIAQLILQIRPPTESMDGSLRFTIPFDERGCMTPLHAAVRKNSPECVRLILEHGEDERNRANVNAKDELGMEPILHAGFRLKAGNVEEIHKYEEVLDLLLKYMADAKATYTDDSDDIPVSMSALRTAVGLGSEAAVKKLLEKGADPKWGKGHGSNRTALHEAAKGGYLEVLKLLLQFREEHTQGGKRQEKVQERRDWVNLKDFAGNTALHYAAFSGSKSCASFLLENGGNLGVKNEAGLAAVEAILIHIPGSKEFICQLLDSKVNCGSFPEEPKKFEVYLNFQILAPNGKERRAEVVNSFITARNVDADVFSGILDHPLVKAYVNLEFSRNKIILLSLLLIYFLQVLTLSLSVYFLVSGNETAQLSFQVIHLLVSILVLIHVGYRLLINFPYFFFSFEFFFNGVGALLSFLGLIMLWCGLAEDWITDVISSACLFQWIGFMSLCGLLPFVGTRTLVFNDVFRNLCWTTGSFIFVMIGFAMFFYYQLHSSHDQFKGFFASLESTVIMLVQDYSRGDIYSETSPPSTFFRIMFTFFMFIGPILLLNLLLSLTISDRDLMLNKGKSCRLYRMIEFLDFVDKAPLLSRIKIGEEIPSIVTRHPYEVQCLRYRCKILALLMPSRHHSLSKKLEGELVSLASKKGNTASIPS